MGKENRTIDEDKHFAAVLEEHGQRDLNSFVNFKGSDCLNEDDNHPFISCLSPGPGHLQSDCDEQLLLSLAFRQPVKIHSIIIKAPKDNGPKTVRIFINQPNNLDFDGAKNMTSTQDLELTPAQLEGGYMIPVKQVKFQSIQNLQLFFKDNQAGAEVTVINQINIMGTTVDKFIKL